MTIRVAMWSGPRNLSMAMIYAFAARGDCAVTDEPFYAAYLAQTGLDHPLRGAVLASRPTDPARIILTGAAPDGAPLWYQKHMTEHLLRTMPTGWMDACHHAFLIRHPARVIASYARKHEDPTLDDLGFARQHEIFDQITDRTGTLPPAIDSADIRASAGPMLRALCAALDIPFTDKVLHWAKGPKHFDGALPDLPPAHADLAEAAVADYQALARHALKP